MFQIMCRRHLKTHLTHLSAQTLIGYHFHDAAAHEYGCNFRTNGWVTGN